VDSETCPRCDESGAGPERPRSGAARIALLGNPNTGKTTLFNRLCGLRHKTSNFPGTTQESRIGTVRRDAARNGRSSFSSLSTQHPPPSPRHPAPGTTLRLIDLPGVYSLTLAQSEAEVCREVLAGEVSPGGEGEGPPEAICIVADATNLARNLAFVGEMLAQRLPMVVALNMIDLAHRAGIRPDCAALEEALGCPVIACCARSGAGLDELAAALARARVPNRTPPGDRAALEEWADEVASNCCRYAAAAVSGEKRTPARGSELTDRLDRVFTHPVAGPLVFAGVMAALFYGLFKVAGVPMDLVDQVFGRLADLVHSVVPAGIIRDLLADGVVRGVGSTVIFLPQICLLFFLISLLEDTGYLARAAFLMDRLLRPFGLPGHAFVPLLSSHACALPGIMATRAIPDRRDRLATILVAPFMTCSARIPVYVLVTGILFKDRPAMAALAFVGCYALGIAAGLFSALVARRTILRGKGRAMALELPTYKIPSLRTALLTTYDRAMVFLKNAGTNILAICIVLWWLGAFPHVAPPSRAVELRERAAMVAPPDPSLTPGVREDMLAEADRIEASHAKAESYAGRLGRFMQPVFAPLGYDWQLTVGVLTSFAAREVFVSTMAIVVTGSDDTDDPGIVQTIRDARRSDGVTPVFTPATSWSLLVFYVLAMQCLPTLVVTAREAGGVRWALLQLAWMSGLAYLAALGVYRLVLALGP